MQLGEYDAALATFTRARSLAPGEAVDHTYLVQANLNAKRFDAARAILQPLRAARPNDARLAQLEARALAGAGRRDEAIALLRRAVDANPGELSSYLALADLLQEGSHTDEALRVLDEAGTRFQDSLDVAFQRGALLDRAKDPGRAEAAFREVLRRDPLHAPALNYLGYMFAERGERLDEAVSLIQRALEVDPGNGLVLDSLGWAYTSSDATTSRSRRSFRLPISSPRTPWCRTILATRSRRSGNGATLRPHGSALSAAIATQSTWTRSGTNRPSRGSSR